MPRTDCHRPGAIVPADYAYAFGFNGATEADGWPIPPSGIDTIMALRSEGRMADIHSTLQCDVCGNRFVWGFAYEHTPSGLIVTMGEDCAAKYEMAAADPRWANFKGRAIDRAKRAAELITRRRQAREYLTSNPDLRAALKAVKNHDIGADLRRSLYKWSALTEAQVGLVFKLQKDEAARAVREAADAERTWIDVPESDERITVVGEVLSTRWIENDFGGTLKMLVRVDAEAGCYKLWGSVPGSIMVGERLRGVHITFTARVERSNHDAGFGFYKRPTKAAIVEEVPA